MPKSITLGNGNILVGLDSRAQVRDFYFPHVGRENHVSGENVHRIGLFVDGHMSWLDDPDWDISIDCDKETAVGRVLAKHSWFQITLHFTDVVYNEKNIFIRKVEIENHATRSQDVKLIFAQQFRIMETSRGDTGYFDPRCNAIIHYKGKRAFLVNAKHGTRSFTDYTLGIFGIEGKEGSHLDANDGELSKNPIEHGSVDSVLLLDIKVKRKSKEAVHYWIVAGKSVDEVRDLNAYVIKRTPSYLMRTARDYWHAWVNRQNFSFYGLDENVVHLFKKSLFVVRAHTDNGGGIIASSDSDMLQHGRDAYSYVWPRDGAFAALALDRAGDFNIARRFFQFANDVITPEGYMMHKYLVDKSLGSSWHPWIRNGKSILPIQEDETALVLIALWNHYELSKDIEFIEKIYNTLIKRAGDFLAGYVDEKTQLPYPSYDLWEEKFGIATFTCSAKYGALLAAAKFADLFGKTRSANAYRRSAENVQKAMLKYLYNEERGMFYKLINIEADGSMTFDDTIDVSSFYGVFRFGVLDINDARLTQCVKTIEETLLNKSSVGGLPRYEGDNYFRTGRDAPPNPWFITTLWLAQYYACAAKTEHDLKPVKEWLAWSEKHALQSGVLPEQLHPYSGSHLSIAPLTWSHSTYINTVIDYLEKLEELGICKSCNPVNR